MAFYLPDYFPVKTDPRKSKMSLPPPCNSVLCAGLLILGLLTAAAPAPAAPGDLDPAFGTGGKVLTPIGSGNDQGLSVAVQSDGQIVVAGISYSGTNSDFALARYRSTGALDTTFGIGGKVTTPIGSSQNYGFSVAVQSDGKIVVAGSAHNGTSLDFALARYTSAGALDPTFGTGGKVTTPIASGNDYGFSMALQSDGKIVVAGSAHNGNNKEFALLRYTSTGTLDTTFGTGGKVLTLVGGTDAESHTVTVQSDGKIVVAGYAFNGLAYYDFALVRYTSTGALDPTFGSGGMVITPFISNSGDYGRSVAVQSDGKIVVAGYTENATTTDFALVRYTSAGALDPTFGTGGKVTTPVGSARAYGLSVALQINGKIIVAGSAGGGTGTDFALVRYTSAGVLDTTFGTGGKVLTPVGSGDDDGRSVALQGDGKIVMAGYVGPSFDFALVRYEGEPGAPSITTPPAGQFFTLGGGVVLTVTTGGMEPLFYQWQFNGTNLANATNSTLTLTNLTTANAGAYRVVVTNAVGIVTSPAAELFFFGDLKLVAATVLAGSVGQQFRVDYAEVLVPGTTNWQVLTNLTLPSSPFVVVDYSSPGQSKRFYRAVPLP
ncbi:MAG: hypothetical protein FD161_4034 [Limisphaerales bacterium]|nr:MAG: hypothetical protein FD161_4034 [Limisphaerales bacterium]KAG0507243.1 MAG: hypothetical protein E1N63_3586 [Limisphaerales bacterium]TXT47831.1 MAG: hypothetical protein FD140_4021 [Limisphaerales bacterium]